jgi:hypothetical protein
MKPAKSSPDPGLRPLDIVFAREFGLTVAEARREVGKLEDSVRKADGDVLRFSAGR